MGGDAVTDHLAAGQAKAFKDRIERIERGGATVIYGHDDQQWQSLRKGTESYE